MRANILRAKMVEAGFNQRSLAKKIQISENTLSSKINGVRAFDVDEVISICEALNINDNEEKAYIFLSEPSQ